MLRKYSLASSSSQRKFEGIPGGLPKGHVGPESHPSSVCTFVRHTRRENTLKFCQRTWNHNLWAYRRGLHACMLWCKWDGHGKISSFTFRKLSQVGLSCVLSLNNFYHRKSCLPSFFLSSGGVVVALVVAFFTATALIECTRGIMKAKCTHWI